MDFIFSPSNVLYTCYISRILIPIEDYNSCLQEKCEHYWPNHMNTSMKIGSEYTVTVVLYVPSAEYQIRKIQLKSVKNILSQIMDDDSLFFRGQSQNMNWL